MVTNVKPRPFSLTAGELTGGPANCFGCNRQLLASTLRLQNAKLITIIISSEITDKAIYVCSDCFVNLRDQIAKSYGLPLTPKPLN